MASEAWEQCQSIWGWSGVWECHQRLGVGVRGLGTVSGVWSCQVHGVVSESWRLVWVLKQHQGLESIFKGFWVPLVGCEWHHGLNSGSGVWADGTRVFGLVSWVSLWSQDLGGGVRRLGAVPVIWELCHGPVRYIREFWVLSGSC